MAPSSGAELEDWVLRPAKRTLRTRGEAVYDMAGYRYIGVR
jgi:hypothetical protein